MFGYLRANIGDLMEKPEEGGKGRLTIFQKVSAKEREQLVEILAKYGQLIGQGCARETAIRLEMEDAYPSAGHHIHWT